MVSIEMKAKNLMLPLPYTNAETLKIHRLNNDTRNSYAPRDKSFQNGAGPIAQTIEILTRQLADKNPSNRKRVILEIGKTLHAKALEPLCNIALFDRDETVRTVALTVITEIIRENHKKMRLPHRRVFVIHNVLNSWCKFPNLRYARAVRWFFSSINFRYEREEALGLSKTILGKKVTATCLNKEIQQVLDDISNIICSGANGTTSLPSPPLRPEASVH